MIKVDSIDNMGENKYKVSLFADTKAEVQTATSEDIKGFPAGGIIEQGSSVLTASAELAFMKSDGTWNWV